MRVSLPELADFAKKFVAELPHTQGAHAHVVGLKGELGAGKTTFVQMVARELGVKEIVTSPTFIIAGVYPITHALFTRLVHIDAYRLQPNDRDTIGWADYFSNPLNLIIVEWPERLPTELPTGSTILHFETVDEATRQVLYNN